MRFELEVCDCDILKSLSPYKKIDWNIEEVEEKMKLRWYIGLMSHTGQIQVNKNVA